MLGQRFRLKTDTIATVFQDDGKRVAVQIPAGGVILVIDSVPDPVVDRNQQVNAKWEGRTVTLFAVDIGERGKRIPRADG